MSFFSDAADAGRALRDDIRVIGAQFGRQDIFFHAGSVAYSALLAGVPFVLLLGSVIGYVTGYAPAKSNAFLERFVSELLPEQAASAAMPIVQGVLLDVQRSRGAVGILGLLLFAWFSTRLFGTLRSSLGSVFAVEKGRGILQGKLFDMMYVLIGVVFVAIYIGINAYLTRTTTFGIALLRATRPEVDPASLTFFKFFAARLVAMTFLATMFAGLYKFLPNRHVGWESVAWGGVWGATLFEITRNVIFVVVARTMNPASLYSGTLAAIVVVVFWAYYAAVVFLIGGVVARVHEMRASRQNDT